MWQNLTASIGYVCILGSSIGQAGGSSLSPGVPVYHTGLSKN